MRIHGIILSFGVLALLPGLAWPAAAVKKQKASGSRIEAATPGKKSRPTAKKPARKSPPADSALPRAPSAPGLDPEELLSRSDSFADPFGEFLRQTRLSEDSLHYRLGEKSFERQRFDSALGHHLAAHVPASGTFRDTLLAQRGRIFARVWPAAAPGDAGKDTVPKDTSVRNAPAMDSLAGTPKPEFSWGMGTSHSRGLFRTGAWQPDGWRGMGFEERYWTYHTFARQSWPLSIGSQALMVAANVNQSTAGAFATLDAALEAHIPEGILENLAVAVSGGLRKSQEWGSYRSYDLMISKGWYSESWGAGLQAGFSREWDDQGKRLNDNAWITLRRDIGFEGGSTLGLSLLGAFDTRDPQYDWITTSVLYVDDVSKARPTHFRSRDFRDTLHGNAGDALQEYARHAGALQLAMVAPRAYLSLGPSLHYEFPLPGGFGAMAGARYAVDYYRKSAWDWVPGADSLDLANADLAGLAFNRADGRYYAAALVEEDGGVREAYGNAPLQHRKANRLDQRAGLNLGCWRTLPHGYTLALEASGDFGWSNLSHSSPIGSQPWRWGLTFNLSRSSHR